MDKLREVYLKMREVWEKHIEVQPNSEKLQQYFFFISGEVYIKMRVFRKTERSLREAGRSLGKLREVYFKMREVWEKLGVV